MLMTPDIVDYRYNPRSLENDYYIIYGACEQLSQRDPNQDLLVTVFGISSFVWLHSLDSSYGFQLPVSILQFSNFQSSSLQFSSVQFSSLLCPAFQFQFTVVGVQCSVSSLAVFSFQCLALQFPTFQVPLSLFPVSQIPVFSCPVFSFLAAQCPVSKFQPHVLSFQLEFCNFQLPYVSCIVPSFPVSSFLCSVSNVQFPSF